MYKLLIADDEKSTRSALCQYYPWNEVGFEVVGQVDNGQQVLQFVKSNSVDVILCDIKMPVMDGVSVAEALYKQKSNTKIVFISAYRDFSYVQNALKYGVRNYILKPTKYNEITEVFLALKTELDSEKANLQDSGYTSDEYGQVIEAAIKYMNANLAVASLESTAANAGLASAYFSRYFKECTGKNFSDFLTAMRMDKAEKLLMANMKVGEIASKVGYNSPKAFSRAFSSYFGYSPSDCRKGAGKGNEKQ